MSSKLIRIIFTLFILIAVSTTVKSASSYNYLMQAESTRKTLTSPNYPASYAQHVSFTWTIKSNTSFSDPVIKVRVLDSELEYSLGCFFDYVNIYDGATTLHGSMATWCGTKYPGTVLTSLYNTIIVNFETDAQNNNYRGFSLEFWAEQRVVSKYGPITLTMFNYVLLGLGLGLFLILAVALIGVAIARKYLVTKKV